MVQLDLDWCLCTEGCNSALSFYASVTHSCYSEHQEYKVSHTCCVCVPSLCPCLCSWTSADHGICSVFCPMLDWSGGCWSGFGVPSCLYRGPVLCPSPSRAPAPSPVPSPSRVPFPAPSPSLPPLCAFSPFPPSRAHGLLCPS